MKWFGLFTLLTSIGTLAVGSAEAHSPYLRAVQPYETAEGLQFSIGMLYGDGIFGPDLGRPVILDDSGKVVALGPLSGDGFVICGGVGDCVVLLAGGSTGKVEPSQSSFGKPRAPDFYPENDKGEYGFKSLPLDLGDRLVMWTMPFRRAPMIALAACLIFGAVGFALVATVRRATSAAFPQLPHKSSPWSAASHLVMAVILVAAAPVLILSTAWLAGSTFTMGPLLAAMAIGVSTAVFGRRILWRT